MISVPAGVTSTERRAVIEAAIRAGAKNAYVSRSPYSPLSVPAFPSRKQKATWLWT